MALSLGLTPDPDEGNPAATGPADFWPPIDHSWLASRSAEQLRSLSAADLESLFRHYSRHSREHMPGSPSDRGLDWLAEHCVSRVMALHEAHLRRQQPTATNDQIRTLLARARPYVLPGKSGDPQRNVADMRAKILADIALKRPLLTRADFVQRWNAFAASTILLRDSGGCAIL